MEVIFILGAAALIFFIFTKNSSPKKSIAAPSTTKSPKPETEEEKALREEQEKARLREKVIANEKEIVEILCYNLEEKAKKLEQKGKYEQAFKQYEKILEIDGFFDY